MSLDANGNEVRELSKKETWELRKKHVGSPTAVYFKHDPIKIVRGEGQFLIDEKNMQYLDCINNVAHVGHSHPAITKASVLQMSLLCTNSRYLHDNHVLCAQRLASLFPHPLDVCFFTNSGSESNDLALALAKSFTGGQDVITQANAYHGHVKSCLDVSPYKWKHPGEGPDYVHVVSSPDVYRGIHADSANPGLAYANEVKEAVQEIKRKKKKLSAFIMESMQSCGGQIIPPAGYMLNAFRYVREAGGVCIADEVQVGFGRVGTHYWAFEMQGADVVPDIVTVGKPMGNGHPVSAVVTRKEIADSFDRKYFNTYGGNPVSCAIANTVMNIIEEENLMENAIDVGQYALEKLLSLKDKHLIIGDVRGCGLFIGVELVKNRMTKEPAVEASQMIYERMKERYILVSLDGPYENVIKFKPPMCFNHDNVDQLIEALDDAISLLSF